MDPPLLGESAMIGHDGKASSVEKSINLIFRLFVGPLRRLGSQHQDLQQKMIFENIKYEWSDRGVYRFDITYTHPETNETKRSRPNMKGLTDRKSDKKKADDRVKAFVNRQDPEYHRLVAKCAKGTEAPPLAVIKPKRSGLTMGWLLNECLTHPDVWAQVAEPENYVSGVNVLSRLIGNDPIADYSPAVGGRAKVSDLRIRLENGEGKRPLAPRASNTVRKLLGHVRQALNACLGEGVTYPIVHPDTDEPLLDDLPGFSMPSKGKPRTRVLHPNEDPHIFAQIDAFRAAAKAEEDAFMATLRAINDPQVLERKKAAWDRTRRYTSDNWGEFRCYVRLLYETAMRRGEALFLGPKSIDEDSEIDEWGASIGKVTVMKLEAVTTKTHRARELNVSPAIAEMIPEMNATARPVTRVIKRQPVTTLAWCGLTGAQVSWMFRKVRMALKAKGIDVSDVVLHTLRHTTATRLKRRGMPIDELSHTLGHSNIKTTIDVYDHTANERTVRSRRFFQNPLANLDPSL